MNQLPFVFSTGGKSNKLPPQQEQQRKETMSKRNRHRPFVSLMLKILAQVLHSRLFALTAKENKGRWDFSLFFFHDFASVLPDLCVCVLGGWTSHQKCVRLPFTKAAA